jgi:hypothetical protein
LFSNVRQKGCCVSWCSIVKPLTYVTCITWNKINFDCQTKAQKGGQTLLDFWGWGDHGDHGVLGLVGVLLNIPLTNFETNFRNAHTLEVSPPFRITNSLQQFEHNYLNKTGFCSLASAPYLTWCRLFNFSDTLNEYLLHYLFDVLS